MRERRKPFLKVWLLLLWAVFTVSLSTWWLIFGMRQQALITEAGIQSTSELARGHRMLLFEGATLVCTLLGGAAAFYLLALRERKQSDAIQRFLLTFTHELKTPIASLRLQAEELQERLKDSKEQPLLERLVSDTSRLTLQLDNSLYLSSENSDHLIVESIQLSELLELLTPEWPNLLIKVQGDAIINADKRALQSIFRNLFNNAVAHGRAKSVTVKVTPEPSSDRISICLQDDGVGFKGDLSKISKLFQRHYSGSGSGIGLYLVGKLSKMLGGEGKVVPQAQGFSYVLTLPGRIQER